MSNADLIKRLRKFLDERAKMKGVTPEIHGLHLGTERQAQLTVDDLEQAVAILQAHEWRADMENAPRDGKPFLMGWPDYVTEMAMWDCGTSQFVRSVWQRGQNEGDEHTPDILDAKGACWKPLDTAPDTQDT